MTDRALTQGRRKDSPAEPIAHMHTLQLEVYNYNNLNVNYCHIFENNSIVPPKLFVSRTVLARAGNTRGTDLSPDLQHIWPGIKLSHYPCTQSGQAASQTGS